MKAIFALTALTVGNMKALFAQKALYSASPILPQAAFPALPARGGAAGRKFAQKHLTVVCDRCHRAYGPTTGPSD